MPIFYFWPEFYNHFYVYLTGTVISDLITRQWSLVLASIIVFSLFLIPLSFRRRAKWIDYSLGTAFFISLFIEMYGIPLTVVFASRWLFKAGVELPASIVSFRLWGIGIGMDLPMVYGAMIMIVGMLLIIVGWATLYRSLKTGGEEFVVRGIYKYSRHPQYLGFALILIGWLIGWPTILTVIFVPILVWRYVRVSLTEEKEIARQHTEYREYKKETPFWI